MPMCVSKKLESLSFSAIKMLKANHILGTHMLRQTQYEANKNKKN